MNLHIATIVIIAANVLVSMKGFNDFSFFEKYKFHVGSIKRGEQIRMFSSGFLHVDTAHLLFNMLTLYFFANVVIQDLGAFKFILVYVASLIIGSLFSLFFHKNEYHYSAVGASGAVTGILYSGHFIIPKYEFVSLFHSNSNSSLYLRNCVFIIFYIWHEVKNWEYWSYCSLWRGSRWVFIDFIL